MPQAAVDQRKQDAEESHRAHGIFCWNELMTRDVERAKRFYQSTIGWSFDGMPMPDGGTYWVAKSDGKPVAGIFPLHAPQYDGVPESWMSYLAVDDVDARVEKAVKAGAKLIKPIFDVPNVGRIAILMEPGGAGVGWMTPLPRGA
ncbi:MAG TPA: VOC family protein [Xanthobacteraceae bacterium]|nr:VOC family protein [Xanthobacteraceae bacterium]